MYEEIFATSQAQVLHFLADQLGQAFYEKEIVEGTGVSHSAVNLATRSLHQAGLLLKQQRGRMNFYSADDRHPFVRQFKVLTTIAQLEILLQTLRSLARQVILFGSCAQGTDTPDSDVDLFILASNRSQVITVISQQGVGRPIQPVVVTNQELAAIKENEPAFYAQVQQGILLWKDQNELAT